MIEFIQMIDKENHQLCQGAKRDSKPEVTIRKAIILTQVDKHDQNT